ncbi:adenylate/guanylate cyclase domain-containing protein [Streptomyces sp. NPDC059398]|uniref:adenylate/guanylate cyclase domain-containing protein n=1 Tax=Streptomyces sp. NPDC059398 TaxID=3346820 RepID=UPI0036AF5B4C
MSSSCTPPEARMSEARMPETRMTAPGLEETLLGGARRYTREQVAEESGLPPDDLRRLWRALGFAAVDDDAVIFTDADVAAARTAARLFGSGLVAPGQESAVTRALGHHLARLAEWQMSLVVADQDSEATGAAGAAGAHGETSRARGAAEAAAEALPALEHLQNYVWRRHLAAHAGRVTAAPPDAGRSGQVIGFVDMVGYTALTRRVGEAALVDVLERFESLAADAVSRHGGRIVKTIGDEVLFLCDSPGAAADTALELTESAERDTVLPELRTGLAYGQVVHRLGDVYGEVVNIAARLTSVARPGTILTDESFATGIGRSAPGGGADGGADGGGGAGGAGPGAPYRLRSLRPVSVRGYSRLRVYALRRGR